jgi:hypothetical protein
MTCIERHTAVYRKTVVSKLWPIMTFHSASLFVKPRFLKTFFICFSFGPFLSLCTLCRFLSFVSPSTYFFLIYLCIYLFFIFSFFCLSLFLPLYFIFSFHLSMNLLICKFLLRFDLPFVFVHSHVYCNGCGNERTHKISYTSGTHILVLLCTILNDLLTAFIGFDV